MDKLQEQSAPDKNSDNAFVKVGADGKPEMPKSDDDKNVSDKPAEGSVADR